ncbi:hypothetical protein [Microcoleus anatoxicus]|uniref:Uncharacterized protein n=1 Tax=Microcoleus anatoxicus PTRS2 TaxID=2705321 RepID=A0ABU8YIX1_9CYAN
MLHPTLDGRFKISQMGSIYDFIENLVGSPGNDEAVRNELANCDREI